jgi:hypothetical protein
MRWLATATILAACGDPAVVNNAHIIVDGYDATSDDCRDDICGHNENTDLTVYDGATYFVHRTAESQILGPNSSIRVSRSTDHGRTWDLLTVMPAIDGRDLRDPCFYTVGDQLAIKALTRLAVTGDRDSNTHTIAVGAVSPDAGVTWSPLAPIGPETWSFWRIKDQGGAHYNAAYADGDTTVRLFSSADGTAWTMGSVIWDHAEDTPGETELVFMPSGKLLALVRLSGTNDELLGSQGRLRTGVCWSDPPYAAFACPQILDGVRFDGPVAFFHDDRLFVVARKHILGEDNRKRTALYELVGDLDGGELAWIEHTELPSTGDTAYAGVAPIDSRRVLVTWYSSILAQDGPWARALLEPTDVWQAELDLSAL